MKTKVTLVDGWHQSWKWASVQLAAFVAILAGILAANPSLLLGLINYLPEGRFRTITSIGVSLVVFIIPTITRLLKKAPCDDETN